jgi:hypothetical protein
MKLIIYERTGRHKQSAMVTYKNPHLRFSEALVKEKNLTPDIRVAFHINEDEAAPNNQVLQLMMPGDAGAENELKLKTGGSHTKALSITSKKLAESGFQNGQYRMEEFVLDGVTYYALKFEAPVKERKMKEKKGAQDETN